jgi:integrase
MASKLLTATFVKNAPQGFHRDGDGLYLRVKDTGAKSWVLRFRLHGEERRAGVGAYPAVGLAEARERADELRRQIRSGIDPVDARKRQTAEKREQSRLEEAKRMTFDQCAQAYINGKKAEWKNAKHGQQWENTLATYASPLLGNLSIADIDLGLVMKVLDPIWRDKTETASRVRSLIEAVLDWAKVHGYRSGDNPAQWRGNLDNLLPMPKKVSKPENQPALDYRLMGAFMAHLRQQTSIGAKPLELAILANARAGEVCCATWSEIDSAHKCWIIPAGRMKAGKEHRIPLSDAAIRLLESLPRVAGSEFIFPGTKEGKAISDATMNKLIRQMHESEIQAGRAGYIDTKQGRVVVTHGFRSTFRDWAGETTAYTREVIEHAMAHQLKDKAEAAYARGSMLEKRRRLMDDWAVYCSRLPVLGEVTPIRKQTVA